MSENLELIDLYDYIFWYNPYEKLWYAISRNTINEFFGGRREKSVFLAAKKQSWLVELLTSKNAIKNLVDECV